MKLFMNVFMYHKNSFREKYILLDSITAAKILPGQTQKTFHLGKISAIADCRSEFRRLCVGEIKKNRLGSKNL